MVLEIGYTLIKDTVKTSGYMITAMFVVSYICGINVHLVSDMDAWFDNPVYMSWWAIIAFAFVVCVLSLMVVALRGNNE